MNGVRLAVGDQFAMMEQYDPIATSWLDQPTECEAMMTIICSSDQRLEPRSFARSAKRASPLIRPSVRMIGCPDRLLMRDRKAQAHHHPAGICPPPGRAR